LSARHNIPESIVNIVGIPTCRQHLLIDSQERLLMVI